MAKAKKLPSGNWRAQVFNGYKYVDGVKKRDYISISAPTEKEANYLALEHELHYKEISRDATNMTLAEAIDKYISNNDSILSPSTIQGYKKCRNNGFQNLMAVKLRKITVDTLNREINNELKRKINNRAKSKTLSPKTVINEFGLISAVLHEYYPSLNMGGIKLPEKRKIIKEVLPPEIIFDIIKGTDIELPALLSMWLSFSMSEIRGLTKSESMNEDYLTIRKTVVDIDGVPVEKEGAKEYERVRRLKIPLYIKGLIDKAEGDYLVTMSGQAIYKRWARLLEKHKLPHMTFHDLRHVNASVMAELGIPDKYAQERGGWKTDRTMKQVYQHTFSRTREAIDMQIDNYFNEKMQHEMQHADE